MRRSLALITSFAVLLALTPLAACGNNDPIEVSREALGTIVKITAYGEDEDAVRAAIEGAYGAMAAVEAVTDAHDPASVLSQFNAKPYTPAPLPAEAIAVLDAVAALGVSAEFSPTLLGVSRLYDFENGGAVPDPADLSLALGASRTFVRSPEGTGEFMRGDNPDARLDAGGVLAPGLDFGGAAKGLALDRAREVLRTSGAVTAALITSGSSTVTLGTKPDGTAWRIGIEDPRDPDAVVAMFTFEGEGALSTSGDYQRYFEVDGRRYHHILHPATGYPTQGLRSLTVAGPTLSGLNSDILSTALFVLGADEAKSYASEAGLALFTVDAEGRTLMVPAPEDSGLTVAEKATPKP